MLEHFEAPRSLMILTSPNRNEALKALCSRSNFSNPLLQHIFDFCLDGVLHSLDATNRKAATTIGHFVGV
jgi:hypothetical protein